MNAAFIAGQQSICFFVLVILIVSLFSDRRREAFSDILLCVAVLLLCAIAMGFANQTVWRAENRRIFHIFHVAALALTIAAGAALAGAFRFWKASNRTAKRRAAFISALIPIWLAGLGWIFTQEAALFSIAETFSLIIVLFFYQRDVEAALKQRAEEIANHQAMLFQWQMRPHFLFNTISTIRDMMDSNPSLASFGLDNLAGYLRKNLDALTLEHMIPFERELEHIEQYVALEKMNPNNRFEVVYDLRIIDFCLPALSVQPLVENAIRHGVRALDEEGLVFVITERHGDMIRIIVEDNGPGFPKDATQQQRQHISRGLENVRKRLEIQCGGSLHIHSNEHGTRLVVLIPKKV